MNATVAWSYQLLGPNEQRAFRRFGSMPSRFSIEAAAAVLAGREDSPARSDEALGAVAGLIDKSLLLRAETSVPTRPMYEMLETVRAYAALELSGSGERDDALDGLARYCTAEASLAAELVGPAQSEWLDRVRDDLESYRSGLAWLIERGRPAEASQIAWSLMLFWVIRGHAAEGLRWYEQILTLPSLPPDAESRALLGTAFMWYAQGELERARTGLTRALALAHGAGDMDMVVQAENLFGYIEHAVGNFNALVPLAAAAVLKGDDAWTARILGARDAVTESTGATVVDKSVHDLRERAEHEVRARLGPDRWARAYAAGRVNSIDSLLKDIDSVLRSRARA